jgi:hypothetical protein
MIVNHHHWELGSADAADTLTVAIFFLLRKKVRGSQEQAT